MADDRTAPHRAWRLLPDDPEIGWVPYGWLVYLPFQFVALWFGRGTAGEWLLTSVAMAFFLVLYFRSYWVCGTALLWYAAAMTLLGGIVTVDNPAAAAYFVYAAALVGNYGNARLAWRFLGILLVVVAAYCWAVHVELVGAVSALVFTALIGAIRIRSAETDAHNASLRRAHDEVERLAAVAERERIARDLHDVLGHTLSVIVLKSELAARLAEADIARAASEIADVERIARDSLRELREAIAGYRATGLASEIARARDVLETAGVRVECDIADVHLPPRQEGVVSLAIREAVTNVVRHAAARTCRLSLAQSERECRFEIADDGRGGASAEGSGLLGMRERVEALGGTLERRSDRGTRLTLTLPLGGAA